MGQVTCARSGCASDQVYARGLCRLDYQRAYKSGTLDQFPRVRKEGSLARRPAECKFCGVDFVARKRSGDAWVETCSKSCAQRLRLARGQHAWQLAPRYGTWTEGGDPVADRERWRRRDYARRARLADVESEFYTAAEIAERDGYRCGLCRRKVRMDLAWPHPRSASIDHIIPLSHGGEDLKTNAQLSHLRCNIAKGNRSEWGQQLLIG